MKKYIISILSFLLLQLSLIAQCFPDKHNTTWYDGWISCDAADNPNIKHGKSHWILYDFNDKVKITGIHVWNSNVPEHIDYGLKNVIIDYSEDTEEWHTLGTFTFEQAPGKNTYQGFDIEGLQEFETKYLLITAVDNYGGSCYGLSEIRFFVDSAYAYVNENLGDGNCLKTEIFPNPFYTKTNLKITTNCDKTSVWYVTDTYGRKVTKETKISKLKNETVEINADSWMSGVYFVTVRQDNIIKQLKIVKLNR
jgi:hypothetical protein